jgi:hypothetical protein
VCITKQLKMLSVHAPGQIAGVLIHQLGFIGSSRRALARAELPPTPLLPSCKTLDYDIPLYVGEED